MSSKRKNSKTVPVSEKKEQATDIATANCDLEINASNNQSVSQKVQGKASTDDTEDQGVVHSKHAPMQLQEGHTTTSVEVKVPATTTRHDEILVEFSVHYNTAYGQEVRVVGSLDCLGAWDARKGVKMHWRNNGLWYVRTSVPSNVAEFEYKFVVLGHNNERDVWEQGQNHHAILKHKAKIINVRLQDSWNHTTSQGVVTGSSNDMGVRFSHFPCREKIASPRQRQQLIRLMSFNIRYDTEQDLENRWVFRRKLASQLILHHRPDVVGIQEALFNQVFDLESDLGAFGYKWVGVGRGYDSSNNTHHGEFNPIFYNSSSLCLQDSGTFWLGPNPEDKGTKAWGANLPRICTWCQLRDKLTNHVFMVFNTHFDHDSRIAREQSGLLIRRKVHEKALGLPSFIMGDLNCEPSESTYRMLASADLTNTGTNHSDPQHMARLYDTSEIAQSHFNSPSKTFWPFGGSPKHGIMIDYIFVAPGDSKKKPPTVLQFGVLDDSYEDGRRPSDHCPICVDCMFENISAH